LSNLASITRANFLPLTLVIIFAGLGASSYSHMKFNSVDAALALIGGLLTHASVNAYNNYFDYSSRIDERTTKTPFSGGVETLVKGQMKPSQAFAVATLCLIGAGLVGIYFLLRLFYALLPFILYGVFIILLYTPLLSKIHGLSEFVAGSGFGLMGLGAYVTQAGVVDAAGITVFVPVTILVALLLFLNEFPDAEVDKAAGRRHLVILLGKKTSAKVYVAGLAATYLSILLAVVSQAAPFAVLGSLVTLPMAFKAGRRVLLNYDRTNELVPALGLNVVVILSTILLLGVGFVMAPYV